jgi:hypothetical protein
LSSDLGRLIDRRSSRLMAQAAEILDLLTVTLSASGRSIGPYWIGGYRPACFGIEIRLALPVTLSASGDL